MIVGTVIVVAYVANVAAVIIAVALASANGSNLMKRCPCLIFILVKRITTKRILKENNLNVDFNYK